MSHKTKKWPADIPEKDTIVIVPPGTRLYVEDNSPRQIVSIVGEEWIGVVIGYKEYHEPEHDYSVDYVEVLIGDRIYNVMRTNSSYDSYFNLQKVKQ